MDIPFTAVERPRYRVLLIQIAWQNLLTLVLLGTFFTGAWAQGAGAGNSLAPGDIRFDQVGCSNGGVATCKVDDTLMIRLYSRGAAITDDTWSRVTVVLSMPQDAGDPQRCGLSFQPRVVAASPAGPNLTQASVWLSPAFDVSQLQNSGCFMGRLQQQPRSVVPVDVTLYFGGVAGLRKQIALDVSTLYASDRLPLSIQQPHCEDGDRTFQNCTVEERLLLPVAHLNQELEALGLRAEDLTLLLDGVPMASKATEECEKDACELSFPLHRVIASISTPGGTEKDSPNAAAWSELFSHWDDDAKSVSVALRHDAKIWLSGSSVSLHTRRVYGMPLMLMVGTGICMIVLFTLLPGVVREGQYFPDTWKAVGDAGVARRFLSAVVGAPAAADCLKPVEAARRLLLPPVSLSQTLTVWWLVIVMLSFGYMLYVTHSVDIVNATMLALLGLPVAVTAGACVVDRSNSRDGCRDADLLAAVTGDQGGGEQVRALLSRARETMLITQSLATDLLSETTPGTWDPHRGQILGFSAVFGIYYMSQLNRVVALPDFSSAGLTLLGISGATYLGFKVVKGWG